ncbi:MAG: nucleotidyltransferase domain-containing protein [Pyrinomonadaceae bacterium]
MPPVNPLETHSASPEAELLVHCARLEIDPDRAERIRMLAGSSLNWTQLLALAQRHALIPLLFFQLNRIASEQVPADQLKQLRDRSQSNAALNVLLTGEMVRLLELFERNQILAVPYKGPAIGVGIYGNSALRQFADLDILVPDTSVWQATELLIESGYQAHFTIPARKRSSFIRLGYVRLFKHEADGTTVELHWRLAPRFFGAPFDTSALWKSSRRIELQGASVRVPAAEDLILMLCIHGAKDCWEKLEWVCGLAELIRSEPEVDWEQLLQHAKKIRCLTILYLGLVLAHELLDAPVPTSVLSQLGPRSRIAPLVAQLATRFPGAEVASWSLTSRIRFHLAVKDSLVEKFRYCARLTLTTTPVDWELMQLPEFVSFLYLPLRLLRLLRKYGGEEGELTARRSTVGPV